MGLLLWLGRIAGVGGALVCAVAVVVRLVGQYAFGGFQVGTLLLVGTAAMTFACLCFLAVLTERQTTGR